ncbi:maltoporin [Klebsiella pneumoniae]|nr:maltoporin [Klebsiella pneumoniae]
MTMIKKLPLTMAVIAAFFPLTSVMAQEFTQEQIDAIVAKAVDKALADRQAKIDAAANKKVDVITNPETTAASPDMAIPFGLKFSGYARYGAHFQTGDQKYVGVDGSYNGASAIGRLGNESNGGEFQISKAFKSAQGAIWDLNVMFDHWSDEVNLKKAYVGVTNVLESNPNAYIWAGRDFHQRPQQGINDYFWMNHDGQGAGVDGKLDQGLAKRYAGWQGELGQKIMSGQMSLDNIARYAEQHNLNPQPQSGRQELLENLVNTYIFG